MKIRNKITIPYVTTVVAVAVAAGFVVTSYSEKVIQDIIAQNSAILAQESINKVVNSVKEHAYDIELYALDLSQEEDLERSNETFARMKDRAAYIEEEDTKWRNATGTLAQQVTNNSLSKEIESEFENAAFYTEHFGYPVYSEVLVTNKFGVNVGQTNRTSDYYQADEVWWQQAKEVGTHVGSVRYDESADTYSIDLAARIEDEQGDFLGVVSAVYNVQSIESVLNSARDARNGDLDYADTHSDEHSGAHLTLLDKDGAVIYSTNSLYERFSTYPEGLYNNVDRNAPTAAFTSTSSQTGEEKLFGYAYTNWGNGDISGPEWVLLIDQQTDELFAPFELLRNIIILAVLAAALVALFTALWVGRSIGRPIEQLTKSTEQIAEGNFNIHISEKIRNSSSEVGSLAEAFSDMAGRLREMYTELDEKVKKRTRDLNNTLERMEESKAVDDAILKSIGNGVVVVDNQGKIMFINDAALSLLGLEREEAAGKDVSRIMRKETEKGEQIPYDKYVLARVLEGEKFEADIQKRYYLVRENGSRFPATIAVTPVKLNEKIIGAVELFRDATEDVEVDKAKTEFVSLASHQLRTPLSTVSWYTEMLLAGDTGEITKEQEEFLKEIYAGNQRMIQLVDALLNVSRVEAGTLSIVNKDVDLPQVVEDVLEELGQEVSNKKLNISRPAIQEGSFVLKADPNIVHIVVQNLISNAVKYTPEEGNISVEIYKDGEHIVMSVADTGYGIPDDQKSEIFTKLFRADNVQQKVTDGTGLGLYMVQKIMDKLGGEVWFESEEDKGTTFYVSWPSSGMREQRGTKDLISGGYKTKDV